MKDFDEILMVQMYKLEDKVDDIVLDKVYETLTRNKPEYIVYIDEFNIMFLESNKNKALEFFKKFEVDISEDIVELRTNFEGYFQCDDIDIDTFAGHMYISSGNIDAIMCDDMLTDQKVIDKLVNTEDFMKEFTNVRKEATLSAFWSCTDVVESELRNKLK